MQMFQAVTKKPLEPGDQAFISYGDKCNLSLLLECPPPSLLLPLPMSLLYTPPRVSPIKFVFLRPYARACCASLMLRLCRIRPGTASPSLTTQSSVRATKTRRPRVARRRRVLPTSTSRHLG